MCTLTVIPTDKSGFILTFNRDENPDREMLPLQEKILNGYITYMPIDVKSGGSCIAVSEHGFIVCLHNGGLKNHERKLSYRSSRGNLIKRLAAQVDPVNFLQEKITMSDYEDCTIFIISYKKELRINRFVWDSRSLINKTLSNDSFIHSSATLYTLAQRKKRDIFFQEYIKGGITPDNMATFHRIKGVGGIEDIFIKRNKPKKVETVSTVQVIRSGNTVSMVYHDHVSNKVSRENLIYNPKNLIS